MIKEVTYLQVAPQYFRVKFHGRDIANMFCGAAGWWVVTNKGAYQFNSRLQAEETIEHAAYGAVGRNL